MEPESELMEEGLSGKIHDQPVGSFLALSCKDLPGMWVRREDGTSVSAEGTAKENEPTFQCRIHVVSRKSMILLVRIHWARWLNLARGGGIDMCMLSCWCV